MKAEIYGLYSGQDGRVRYVGQSGHRHIRFKEHVRFAEDWPDAYPLNRWFHHQWRRGFQVRCAFLALCEYDQRHKVESKWIWRFPRSDLLNRRKLLPFWLPDPKPPVLAEIVNYRRRYIFNVEGFRGIHYDREFRYYRVLVYDGRRCPHWLLADEIPWGSGNVGFSDLAQAVSAKDGEMQFYRALMRERRRKDITAGRAREQQRLQTEQAYFW